MQKYVECCYFMALKCNLMEDTMTQLGYSTSYRKTRYYFHLPISSSLRSNCKKARLLFIPNSFTLVLRKKRHDLNFMKVRLCSLELQKNKYLILQK